MKYIEDKSALRSTAVLSDNIDIFHGDRNQSINRLLLRLSNFDSPLFQRKQVQIQSQPKSFSKCLMNFTVCMVIQEAHNLLLYLIVP